MHRRLLFDATIQIRGIDRKGMLRDVSEVLSNQFNIDIRRLTVSSNEGIFDGIIEVRVHERTDLKAIMQALKNVKGMKEIV